MFITEVFGETKNKKLSNQVYVFYQTISDVIYLCLCKLDMSHISTVAAKCVACVLIGATDIITAGEIVR